ncbi:MAG: carbon monoxide dehydrogenase subunit G [Polyangiales bacterium]
MQMTGQERIAASRQHVWEALDNPDMLKRSIPGCQSITREDDGRLRTIAEIKIGPIGARFNALVARTEVNAPNSFTMTIEGQGGTVGFVKSGAKVRLSDDASGGTLLSYDVDAEVGGRLAQLGGPMLDATAKTLAARFFKQLSANIGAPAKPAVASAAVASAGVAAPIAPTAAAPSSRGAPVAVFLALCLATLVGYLIGHAQRGGPSSDWMGLAIGLLLIVVAAVGFEYGKRAAAPTLVLDSTLLARLAEESKR